MIPTGIDTADVVSIVMAAGPMAAGLMVVDPMVEEPTDVEVAHRLMAVVVAAILVDATPGGVAAVTKATNSHKLLAVHPQVSPSLRFPFLFCSPSRGSFPRRYPPSLRASRQRLHRIDFQQP
jgi:hypothetical protein